MIYEHDTISDFKFKPAKKRADADDRPMKGTVITGDSQPHHNIFLAAMKNSGKTTVIKDLIQECADKYTTIVAFAGTLYDDPTWAEIQEWCFDNDVNFIGYGSFDEPVDEKLGKLSPGALDWWVKCLEDENKNKKLNPEEVTQVFRLRTMEDEDEEEEEEDRRKYQTPKYIFVGDDQGNLKHKSWVKLIKRHRHYRAWTISSSQYFNDLDLQARKNMDLIFVFGNNDVDKLEQIYKNSNVKIPFHDFVANYNHITSKRFQFLWINTTNQELRNGVNHRLRLPK